MIAFGFFATLTAVCVERALSGVFAAAVTPVALAAVTDFATTKAALGRRLTFVSLAGISGFLLGPMLGVALTRSSEIDRAAGALAVLLVAMGGLALFAALAVALALPATGSTRRVARDAPTVTDPGLVLRLLALGFVVSVRVAVFEVGLGNQELGLTPAQIFLKRTVCSVVMIVVQAAVFSQRLTPDSTRWLMASAFTVMGAGLFAVPLAVNFGVMLAMLVTVAASVGILSPILTCWITIHAGHKSGADLGKQTSASSLGAALGSAAGGLLYNTSWLPNAAFVLMAGVVLVEVWPSLRLPGRSVPKRSTTSPA